MLLKKDPEQRPSIQELVYVPIIRNAIDELLHEFEGNIFNELINSLIKKEGTAKKDETSLKASVPQAVSEIKELSCAISLIDLPESSYGVSFVYLWADRLYTEIDKTLNVYSVGDLTSPFATYPLGDWCSSALITENRLFLCGSYNFQIFEVTPSLTEPLIPVIKIPIKETVYKILRVDNDLLLG